MIAPEYEIKGLLDFCKVPADRRKACLIDFRAWIACADLVEAMLDEHQVPLEVIEFTWIDDGKHDTTIQFILPADFNDPGYLPPISLPLL